MIPEALCCFILLISSIQPANASVIPEFDGASHSNPARPTISDTAYYERTTHEATNFDFHRCRPEDAKIAIRVSLRLTSQKKQGYTFDQFFTDEPEVLRDSTIDHWHHRESPAEIFGAQEPGITTSPSNSLEGSVGGRGVTPYRFGIQDSLEVKRTTSDSLHFLLAGEISPPGARRFPFHKVVKTNRSFQIAEPVSDHRFLYEIKFLPRPRSKRGGDTLFIRRTTAHAVVDTYWPCPADSADLKITIQATDLLSHHDLLHTFPYRYERRRYFDTATEIQWAPHRAIRDPLGKELARYQHEKQSDEFVDSGSWGKMKIQSDAAPSLGKATLFTIHFHSEPVGKRERRRFLEDSLVANRTIADTVDNLAVTRTIEFKNTPPKR